ncbi:MAG TPA: GAF domain-containing sensor histidine kinase [Candidatus Dojkabacteria bacterium]|nr:GAF domain-containing sensor histidine kinase [Candidatus Dojkabacteria bacterium]
MNKEIDVLELLKSFSELIENYQDKETIKKLVINLVTDKLKFSIAGVFDKHDHYADNLILSSTNMILSQVYKILGTSFQTLSFDLNEPKSIFAQAATKKKYVITKDVEPFIPGINYNVGNLSGGFNAVKKLYGVQELGVFPCLYKGELKAFFAVAHPTSFSKEEIDILNIVTSQLAGYLTFATLTKDLQAQITELAQKNMELAAARKRERDMMDIIGHELRTPLSIIRITIGLLNEKIKKVKDGNEQEDWNKYVVRIDEALEREVTLLETMLSSTKIESNKMELHMEKVEINRVIQDSILAMGNKAQKKGLMLKYAPSSMNLAVYGDQIRFAEVVDNLVLNAIKYTEKGSVEIKTNEEGEFVTISITDTGIGIPEAEIPHLGEKFYRVGQYTESVQNRETREHIENDDISVVRPGGTGLGLYVSFNLVRLMGGEIIVKSSEGKGSTFTVKLPKYTNQPEINSGNAHEKDLFKRLGFT